MRAYIERLKNSEAQGGRWFDTNEEMLQWVDGYLQALRDVGIEVVNLHELHIWADRNRDLHSIILYKEGK